MGRNHVCLVNQDITEWSRLNEKTYNIIMFPKSIGEFSSKGFAELLKILRSSKFERPRVCIACSLIDTNQSQDIGRFVEVVETMEKAHHFKRASSPTQFYAFPNHKGIRAHCYDWVYPQDIFDFVANLADHCPKYKAKGKFCKPDCVNLRRKPIMTTAYIQFQVLGLSRDN
jgi:hypothetical protein